MAKIKKNFGSRPFTTMFNDHFFDKRLSWGAVGMLSNVFSLPDDWEFSVRGFMGMHSDGQRVVTSLLYELEWFGYLERIQLRDTKGKVVDYIYEFFNESQLPDKMEPMPAWKDRKEFAIKRTQIIDIATGEIVSATITENPRLQNVNTDENENKNPHLQNADTGFADTENADMVFAGQLNTNTSITNQLNTSSINNQSINQRVEEAPADPSAPQKQFDRVIDGSLIEKVKNQICYADAIRNNPMQTEMVDYIVECLAQLYVATKPMVFSNVTYDPQFIQDRAAAFTYDHVGYVIDSFLKQTGEIYNIRAYLLSSVFNAPASFMVVEDRMHLDFVSANSKTDQEPADPATPGAWLKQA